MLIWVTKSHTLPVRQTGLQTMLFIIREVLGSITGLEAHYAVA